MGDTESESGTFRIGEGLRTHGDRDAQSIAIHHPLPFPVMESLGMFGAKPLGACQLSPPCQAVLDAVNAHPDKIRLDAGLSAGGLSTTVGKCNLPRVLTVVQKRLPKLYDLYAKLEQLHLLRYPDGDPRVWNQLRKAGISVLTSPGDAMAFRRHVKATGKVSQILYAATGIRKDGQRFVHMGHVTLTGLSEGYFHANCRGNKMFPGVPIHVMVMATLPKEATKLAVNILENIMQLLAVRRYPGVHSSYPDVSRISPAEHSAIRKSHAPVAPCFAPQTYCVPFSGLKYIQDFPEKAKALFASLGRSASAAENRKKGAIAGRTTSLGNTNGRGGAVRPADITWGASKQLLPLEGLPRSVANMFKDIEWECTKCGYVPGGSKRLLRAAKCLRSEKFPRGFYIVKKPHGHYEPPDIQCSGSIRPTDPAIPCVQNKTHCKWFREGHM